MDPHAYRIRERHIVEKGTPARIWPPKPQKPCGANEDGSSGIDLIVLASVTPDMFFLPPPACATAHWRRRRPGLHLSARASGFAYALTVARNLSGAGTHKKAAGDRSDAMTTILDYKDRATCVLFGEARGRR